MKTKKLAQGIRSAASWQYVFCIFTTLTAFLMAVPVSAALTAGIASISLVLFGGLALVLGLLIGFTPRIPRLILGTCLAIALFGGLVPQIALLRTAAQSGASLRFDPLTYLVFSGDTTIPPTRLIAYKSTTRHKLMLAVYASSRPAPSPAVILLHGGGWRYGNHLETGEWPKRLTDAGYTVISAEYRLASDNYHTWRDAPSDTEDTVKYIKAHAATLGVNPEQLTLMGQSAGGHLALLEAYRNNSVRSVISLYAPIDLTLDYATSRDKSAELDFIGGPPSQFPDRYAALSPISYVTADSPKTLLIQGKTDDLVAVQNARLLGARLTDNRVDHSLLLLPLTGHSFENQHGGFATQIAVQRVLRFLDK